MDLKQAFTEKYKKAEPPVVAIGDTVRVHLKVKEGNRERIQVFEYYSHTHASAEASA